VALVKSAFFGVNSTVVSLKRFETVLEANTAFAVADKG